MKLRSLTLTNVRKFAGKTATISGIGDGVTVVSEANEFGKSTFFDALHALFFLKYGTATREVKSLQPPAGGPVRVQAQIELPAGRFTLTKSFLAQKRASVQDAGGTLIALDDEAERWIAQLLESGLEGPAGLLWVRQGVTALEPEAAGKPEKERLLGARRDLLSSVAGEIDMVTGGRRMDRVIEAATRSLGLLATPSGLPKTGGPWKEAEVQAETYAARHAELDAICRALSQALEERHAIAARLRKMDAPEVLAALATAVEKAQAAHTAALAHADRLAQVQSHATLRQLEQERAQSKLDTLIAAAAEYAATQTALDAAHAALEDTSRSTKAAEEAVQSAQTALVQATDTCAAVRAATAAAQHGALLENAQASHDRLRGLLDQVSDKRAALEQAEAALAAAPVTQKRLAAIERAQEALARAQAEQAAGGVQITVEYDGAARIRSGGSDVDAGTRRVPARQLFELPGIGRLHLDPGPATADPTAVRTAQDSRDALLQEVGCADMDAARQGALAHTRAGEEAAMLRNIVATLAPQGVAQLRADAAKAQTALETLAAQQPQTATVADLPNLQAAQNAERAAQETFEQARATLDTARAKGARAQALHDHAQTAFDTATAAYGDAADFDARKASAARDLSTAQTALADAQAMTETIAGAAPDLDTAKATLGRAQSAAQNAQAEREALRTRHADLSGTIRSRAEDGVEAQRDEAAGRLQAATERAARLKHEAAGLTLLIAALREKRGAAQEAYFGPIQRELAPLLSLLHADAALSFDPASLLPQGIARGGAEEPLEMLSGGTQEQIAILTRLAFARLFAKQGKPMPVILDDALVYSDDTRIEAMFTALHRVASDQQVIVFSCRQMAFASLGGARPRVEIVQDI